MHPLVWPLAALLFALVLLHQVRERLNPVLTSVVDGLSKHALRHSLAYGMAVLYATAASLQALADVSREFGWVYVEAFAKVIQPGAVAIIAFIRPSPSQGTQAPFAQ